MISTTQFSHRRPGGRTPFPARPSLLRRVRERLREGPVLSKEYKGGVVEWAAVKLIGLMNVARDITCRHSISESLEKREERRERREGRREEGRKGGRQRDADARSRLCGVWTALYLFISATRIACRLCRDPSHNRVRSLPLSRHLQLHNAKLG